MLKQRIITAAVLIPLVLWALLGLNSQVVTGLFAAVAALAAWEWLQLMGIEQCQNRLLILLGIILTGALAYMFLPATAILAISTSVWCLATLLVLFFAHRPLSPALSALFQSPLFGVLTMTLILTGFVGSASLLHGQWAQGPALLVFVMVTVWLADTGGYFAGKRFGKHKLATAISPNKTWEGVAGGLFLGGVWALIFYFIVGDLTISLIGWLILAGFIVMVSIVGDLLESVFKRSFNVKDSGQLLPGHGGILDRVDSLLAAIPVFTAALLVLGVN